MQRRLHQTVIGNIDRLLEEAAVDSILATNVVLNMRVDVQRSPEHSKVLLSPNVVLYQPPPRTGIDKPVENLNQRLEEWLIRSVIYLLIS